MDTFKSYLLNEEKNYLGHRVGDILTSTQDLQNDMPNMGERHLTRVAETIVNQIRKILHSQWSVKNQQHLKQLQKIAVAVQKTIDDKGDLREIIPAATKALQSLSGKLGVKLHNLQPPEAEAGEEVNQDDFQLTGQEPQQSPEEVPQQAQQPIMPNTQMPQQGMPNLA